ncbi:MAG: CHAD domain-containing protein [Pirellulales bacterium]|jgi:CHAD domain-containing protein|nr:CHAD domain-containing protein [Thermoguttaceae bacterium]MDD4789479.1 CHAD domain-containing protein [Pirellulales bacterium]MDI9445739.1 CHAD domain-containing protein [Planctomycetota bacterium]NLZ01665.1 CHAD domain-containing protein [Pirellulaceae bacterium]
MKTADIPSHRLLTVRYLRKQAKQLSDQLAGVREGEDIEFVHRGRVACRRLRSVLKMSDWLNKRQLKAWRKEVRKLLKGMGKARDKDVQIEFLWDYLAGIGDRSLLPGIARVAIGLEHAREQLQADVVAAVDRAEASGVIGEMLATSKAALEELEQAHVRLDGHALFLRLEGQLGEKLSEFLDHQDSLADPQDEQGHHLMRIAAKQLRYTMEICQPAYRGRLDGFVVTIKRIQSYLGEIHDCDVWIEHLAATLGEEGKRLAETFGYGRRIGRLAKGIEHLRSERRQRRVGLFNELLDYCQELDHGDYWGGLRELAGQSAVLGNVPPGGGQSSAPAAEAAANDRRPAGIAPQPLLHASAENWT